MTKTLAIVGGAVLALAAGAALVYSVSGLGSKHTRVETRTFPGPIRTLEIKTDSGDVELVRGERLVVRETHHYRGSRKPDVSHRVSDDTLTVEDRGCSGFSLTAGCSTDFRIEVPAGTVVRTSSDAGDFAATGVALPELRVETDAGDVEAARLDSRTVHAETDAGDVELAFVSPPSLIEAETDAGDVEIAVPQGTYSVATDTDAGDAQVTRVVNDPQAPNRISARTDAGDIDVSGR
jgi:Toastrack DUF4097